MWAVPITLRIRTPVAIDLAISVAERLRECHPTLSIDLIAECELTPAALAMISWTNRTMNGFAPMKTPCLVGDVATARDIVIMVAPPCVSETEIERALGETKAPDTMAVVRCPHPGNLVNVVLQLAQGSRGARRDVAVMAPNSDRSDRLVEQSLEALVAALAPQENERLTVPTSDAIAVPGWQTVAIGRSHGAQIVCARTMQAVGHVLLVATHYPATADQRMLTEVREVFDTRTYEESCQPAELGSTLAAAATEFPEAILTVGDGWPAFRATAALDDTDVVPDIVWLSPTCQVRPSRLPARTILARLDDHRTARWWLTTALAARDAALKAVASEPRTAFASDSAATIEQAAMVLSGADVTIAPELNIRITPRLSVAMVGGMPPLLRESGAAAALMRIAAQRVSQREAGRLNRLLAKVDAVPAPDGTLKRVTIECPSPSVEACIRQSVDGASYRNIDVAIGTDADPMSPGTAPAASAVFAPSSAVPGARAQSR